MPSSLALTGLILIAIVVGVVMPMQPGMNAKLSIHAGSDWFAMWVNMAVGLVLGSAVAIGVMYAKGQPWPPTANLAQAPWWAWLGGVLGTLIVGASILLIPRMGASLLIASLMSGHILGAMLVDHFGLVGVAVERLTPLRLLAGGCTIVGVLLFAVARWQSTAQSATDAASSIT
jgi:transporter family-2 protein